MKRVYVESSWMVHRLQVAFSVLAGHSPSFPPCSQYNILIHIVCLSMMHMFYLVVSCYIVATSLPYEQLFPFVRKRLLGVLLSWSRISGWVKSTKILCILISIMWLLHTGWTDVLHTITCFYASIYCIMFKHCALSTFFSFSQGLFPKWENCSSLACYYMID